jgi:hypothetical protein
VPRRTDISEIQQMYDEYLHDVYVMLIALGSKEANASALMKQFESQIKRAFGFETVKRCPIVTAQQTARQIFFKKWV